METVHIQKYIHSTPRKLRLVADMIRKLKPDAALTVLRFTNKSAAKDLHAAIKTALASAGLRGLNEAVFKSIEVNEGPKMRRFQAGTRGRVKPFKRRMGHIRIILTDELNVKNQNSKVKNKAQGTKLEEKTVVKEAK